MHTIAMISRKGGTGKSTLARAGRTSFRQLGSARLRLERSSFAISATQSCGASPVLPWQVPLTWGIAVYLQYIN
jgi:hypothetical protein